MSLEGVLNDSFTCFPRGTWPQGIVQADRVYDTAAKLPGLVASSDILVTRHRLTDLGLYAPDCYEPYLGYRWCSSIGRRAQAGPFIDRLSPIRFAIVRSHVVALFQLSISCGMGQLGPGLDLASVTEFIHEYLIHFFDEGAESAIPSQNLRNRLVERARRELELSTAEARHVPLKIQRAVQSLSDVTNDDLIWLRDVVDGPALRKRPRDFLGILEANLDALEQQDALHERPLLRNIYGRLVRRLGFGPMPGQLRYVIYKALSLRGLVQAARVLF